MSEFTVLSAVTRTALDAAAALGVDPTAVREAAGIDQATLDDPDARTSLAQHLKVWEVLSPQVDGLELGARLGVEGLGVVGYAMQHGTTAADALDWLHRFRSLVHPALPPAIERRDSPAGPRVVLVHPVPPPFARLRPAADAYASATVATLSALTGLALRAAWVTFPLTTPSDPLRYERFFMCPVAWDGAALEVAFDAAVLDVPLPRADARLFGYLARRADELLARLPGATDPVELVRLEIGTLLARGEPRLPVVARRLGVSERTLHRRLAESGTGFAALVDEARRDRAMLLLEDRALSCSEIAILLGYSEPAVFFRAFKRWTGTPPDRWRAEWAVGSDGRQKAEGSRQ